MTRVGRRVLASGLIGVALLTAVGLAPAHADPVRATTRASRSAETAVAPVDTSDREAVASAFRRIWVPALETAVDWTGSVKGCRAGANSVATNAAVTRSVNLVRAMTGLGNVTYDDTRSAETLEAALVMQANGRLSHTPRRDGLTTCLTSRADRVAGESNLDGGLRLPKGSSLWRGGWGGRGAAQAVLDYMTDAGDNNTAAGHRRWLLWSRLRSISNGTTSGANAIRVIDPTVFADGAPAADAATDPWTSWPSSGWFPAQLEPMGRWSLQTPALQSQFDLSAARVSMTRNGRSVRVRVEKPEPGSGPDALVWQVAPARVPAGRAVDVYTVRVDGIVDRGSGEQVTKSYEVRIFNAFGDRSPTRLQAHLQTLQPGVVGYDLTLLVRGQSFYERKEPIRILVDGRVVTRTTAGQSFGYLPIGRGRHRITFRFDGTPNQKPSSWSRSIG